MKTILFTTRDNSGEINYETKDNYLNEMSGKENARTDLRKKPLIPVNLEEDDVFRNSKRDDCPLNKEELGNRTWSFLHTMAAHFPEKPSAEDERDMVQFFKILCRFYPCRSCAESFSKLVSQRPPEAGSQRELIEWLCWAHNQVNLKINKPYFDCKLADDRWKFGWKDGSCE